MAFLKFLEDQTAYRPILTSDQEDGVIAAQTAKSLKCEDCGKILRDENAAQLHAMKTEHTNFSESTEAIKPLTPEEKVRFVVRKCSESLPDITILFFRQPSSKNSRRSLPRNVQRRNWRRKRRQRTAKRFDGLQAKRW